MSTCDQRPVPPQPGYILASNKSMLTFAWDPPYWNNGQPITEYEILWCAQAYATCDDHSRNYYPQVECACTGNDNDMTFGTATQPAAEANNISLNTYQLVGLRPGYAYIFQVWHRTHCTKHCTPHTLYPTPHTQHPTPNTRTHPDHHHHTQTLTHYPRSVRSTT